MNKPLVVFGSIAFSACTALAQSAPTPPPPDGVAPALSTAPATRHGRVQGVIASPDGSVSGLFLGGHTAVALTPEVGHQLAAMRLRGREVTASGASQTVGGYTTVNAQTLRIGGSTFSAATGSPVGLAAPPRGRGGVPPEIAGLRGGPAGGPGMLPPPRPGAPAPPPPPSSPNGIAPPPPPPPTAAGVDPRATPPSAPAVPPRAGAVPPPPTAAGGQNEAPVPPPATSAAPGVNGANPPQPPPADGSQPTATPPAPQQ